MAVKFCNYKIQNNTNNKLYIGKTFADTSRRWSDHIRVALDDTGTYKKETIHYAIAKYGLANFTFSIIEYFETEDEAYAGEIINIEKYNSFYSGYNETKGGRGAIEIHRALDLDQARKVIDLYLDGYEIVDLTKVFIVSKAVISDIIHRYSYLDLDVEEEILLQLWLKCNANRDLHPFQIKIKTAPTKGSQQHSLKFVENILQLYADQKYSTAKISKLLNMGKHIIDDILMFRTTRHLNLDKDLVNKVKNLRKQSNSKLNADIVINIFYDYGITGLSKIDIATKYGVRQGNIDFVLKRITWQSVKIDEDILVKATNRYNKELHILKQISNEDRYKIFIEIANDILLDISTKDIAIKQNMDFRNINAIIRRKQWTEIDLPSEIKSKFEDKVKSLYIVLTDKDIFEMMKSYINGDSLRTIADKYHRSRAMTREIIKHNISSPLLSMQDRIILIQKLEDTAHYEPIFSDEKKNIIAKEFINTDIGLKPLGRKFSIFLGKTKQILLEVAKSTKDEKFSQAIMVKLRKICKNKIQ